MAQGLTEQQLAILMNSLNPSRVAKRSQGGSQLSYLEAWDVRATLIRVFGFGGFDAEVVDSKIVHHTTKTSQGGKEQDVIACQATVRLHIKQLDATYSETAAATQTGSQGFGDVLDFCLKTAVSDALKRCAINLGTQFGLSLYQKGSTSEIIRTIVAPGQEFWLGQRTIPESAQEVREGIAENDVASIPPEQLQEPQQGAQPLSGAPLTEEQREANQQIMNKLNQQVEQKEAGQ